MTTGPRRELDEDGGSRTVRHDPNQLKLFYGAQELRDTLTESDDRMYMSHGRESMEEMWSRKTTESKEPAGTGHGSGVYDSIKKYGYDPSLADEGIHIQWKQNRFSDNEARVLEAHHRIAAAADIERSSGQSVWLPVSHDDQQTRRNLRAMTVAAISKRRRQQQEE